MNKVILNKGEYTFNALEKKVTVLNYKDIFKKEYLLIITNVHTNDIIYNFACEGFGGVITEYTILLEQDTTLMKDSDELQIILFIEDKNTDSGKELNTITKYLENIDRSTNSMDELVKELKKLNELLMSIL